MTTKQIETKYIVKKGFKYGSTLFKSGDEFVPEGQKWDKQIVDVSNGLVTLQAAVVDTPETAQKQAQSKPAPARRKPATRKRGAK